ncbi:ydjO [Escherichia coli]|nr:ydjO [Escherichia coli]
MMSLWDALRMNMMISYQELVRTFLRYMLFFEIYRWQPLVFAVPIASSWW